MRILRWLIAKYYVCKEAFLLRIVAWAKRHERIAKYYWFREALLLRLARPSSSPVGLLPTYQVYPDFRFENIPSLQIPVTTYPGRLPFRSELCSETHFFLDHYRFWCTQLNDKPRFHRKQWEFVYILQALKERGLLQSTMRGLGFGIGREPLVSFFASQGCEILATDLEIELASELGWTGANQKAQSIGELNASGLCDDEMFRSLVQYQDLDMNNIPVEIKGFDFCWSACSLEHLGSIANGRRFIRNSIQTLVPGGWAVHTTEFNLTSNHHTVDNHPTVIFRKRDIEAIISDVLDDGHFAEPLLLHNGVRVDRHIDAPPYKSEPHLRLQLGRYATTSIGLIVKRVH